MATNRNIVSMFEVMLPRNVYNLEDNLEDITSDSATIKDLTYFLKHTQIFLQLSYIWVIQLPPPAQPNPPPQAGNTTLMINHMLDPPQLETL